MLILRNISTYFIENRNNHSMCLKYLVGILIKKIFWQKRRQKQEIAFVMVEAAQLEVYTYEQW